MVKRSDSILALFWIALGIFIAAESCTLKLGKLQSPGSGLMPFLLGIILVLCSLPILVQSLLMVKEEVKQGGEGVWSGIDYKKITIVLASLTAYSLFLEKIGYLVSAFFVLLILFRSIESQKWSLVLILSIITVFVTYLFFGVILKVELPSGPIRIIY